MPSKTFEGHLSAQGLRFAIVVSRFNSLVTERLLGGALDAILRHGGSEDLIDLVRVPGSWEQPVVVKALLAKKAYDAVICLGAVVRGDTPHFDYVAGECVSGISAAAREHGVPVGFGVLTVDTIEQAIERAGTKAGNKGAEAALAVIETVNLLRRLD